MRAWPALALACCLAPAWAQPPAAAQKQARKPVPVKAQKTHRKATPEQIRKFNQLQHKSGKR
ncbi:hypothetical protein D3C83_32610 [compost metagenome]